MRVSSLVLVLSLLMCKPSTAAPLQVVFEGILSQPFTPGRVFAGVGPAEIYDVKGDFLLGGVSFGSVELESCRLFVNGTQVNLGATKPTSIYALDSPSFELPGIVRQDELIIMFGASRPLGNYDSWLGGITIEDPGYQPPLPMPDPGFGVYISLLGPASWFTGRLDAIGLASLLPGYQTSEAWIDYSPFAISLSGNSSIDSVAYGGFELTKMAVIPEPRAISIVITCLIAPYARRDSRIRNRYLNHSLEISEISSKLPVVDLRRRAFSIANRP